MEHPKSKYTVRLNPRNLWVNLRMTYHGYLTLRVFRFSSNSPDLLGDFVRDVLKIASRKLKAAGPADLATLL